MFYLAFTVLSLTAQMDDDPIAQDPLMQAPLPPVVFHRPQEVIPIQQYQIQEQNNEFARRRQEQFDIWRARPMTTIRMPR